MYICSRCWPWICSCLWPVTGSGFIGTNFTSFAGSELLGTLSCTSDSGRWVCVWIRMNQLLGWSGQVSFCLASLGLAEIIQSESDTPFCTVPESRGHVRGHLGSVMDFISAKWSLSWFSQGLLYCSLVWLKTSLATLELPTAHAFFRETEPSFPSVYCCTALMTFNSFTQEVTECDCQIPLFPTHWVFVGPLWWK